MVKGRHVKFPCYTKREYGGKKRWCFFDSDGRIAKIPTDFSNFLQGRVPLKYAEGTVETYVSDLMSTLRWMRDLLSIKEYISLDTVIMIVSLTHVEDTLTDMFETGIVSSSISRREVVLRHLFEWCSTERAGYLRTDHPYSENRELITKLKRSGRAQKDIDHFVNYETVGKIMISLHNECERTLIQCLFEVGSRIGMTISMTADQLPVLNAAQRRAATLEDYHKLEWKDVYLPIKVYQSKTRSLEAPARVVVITLPTVKRIQKYHQSLEYLNGIKALGFKFRDKDRPVFLTINGCVWSRRNALSQYRAAIKRAGLPDWMVLHSLRSGAAYLIIGSKDMGKTVFDRLREAKKQLGQKWLSTLEQYYLSLPAPLVRRYENTSKEHKWEILFDLYEETYMPPKKQTNRRGSKHRA